MKITYNGEPDLTQAEFDSEFDRDEMRWLIRMAVCVFTIGFIAFWLLTDLSPVVVGYV